MEAGADAGGDGGQAGSIGMATGGGGSSTMGGSGGSQSGPCGTLAGQACVECCYDFTSFSSYRTLLYECACSDPCYASCQPACDLDQARSFECQRCILAGLQSGTPALCHDDAAQCAADQACTMAASCLRGCM